jgi:hypothetical protein
VGFQTPLSTCGSLVSPITQWQHKRMLNIWRRSMVVDTASDVQQDSRHHGPRETHAGPNLAASSALQVSHIRFDALSLRCTFCKSRIRGVF